MSFLSFNITDKFKIAFASESLSLTVTIAVPISIGIRNFQQATSLVSAMLSTDKADKKGLK